MFLKPGVPFNETVWLRCKRTSSSPSCHWITQTRRFIWLWILEHHYISLSVCVRETGCVCTEKNMEFGGAAVRMLCLWMHEWIYVGKSLNKNEQIHFICFPFTLSSPESRYLYVCVVGKFIWSLSNLVLSTVTMDPFYCDTFSNDLSSASVTLCEADTHKHAFWWLNKGIYAPVFA